ncbi:DUF2510 domain-containing protein [Streptomyces sp. 796.1]|uniref:DUF2510 domain-containing protein n=1 Tax=Streptomyces sp. 796.1 TaxID=3163029 RepID=UPI0039C99A57
MTTPPGWYPDPDHQGPGPAPERWWDGRAWTESRRAAPSVHDAQTMLATPLGAPPAGPPPAAPAPQAPPGVAPYGYPQAQPPGYPPAAGAPYGQPGPLGAGHPGGPGGPPPGRGRRNAVVAVVGAIVVAAIVAGVVVLQDDGDGDGDQAGPTPTLDVPKGSGGGSGDTGGDPTPSTPPSGDPDDTVQRTVDAANAISVPVLDGWTANPPNANGIGITTTRYDCPRAASIKCVRGGVFSFGVTGRGYTATTAEGVAREDIARNAEESYGTGQQGAQNPYGGLDGHQEAKAEPVTVAGQAGYLVRWKVDTKSGLDAHVQSLVFPKPGQGAGGSELVVVRFGFDVNPAAPSLADMDVITSGIEPAAGDGEGV